MQSAVHDTLNRQRYLVFRRTLRLFRAEALFIGGCVRDTLAGRPVRDVDMATDPRRRARVGRKAVPTGLAYGTVTAVCDSLPVEVTTYRRDVATDGRNAMVAFTRD